MTLKPRLTTAEAAKELGICQQRVTAKIKQNHFPGATTCECGRSVLIPREEVAIQKEKRKK